MNTSSAATLLGVHGGPLTEARLAGAWRAYAREHHPDAHPGEGMAGEAFIAGREAYDVLRRRLQEEERAGWTAFHADMRLGRVLRGAGAGNASPYRFAPVGREWSA
ncbi:MAG: hypothetical protein U0Y82_13665 [Thermoleophilia bacterium]